MASAPLDRLHLLRDWRLYLPNPGFANPAWDEAPCRVLILRLSPFADVQKSTPHLFLASEVRSALPGAYIDMAFLPRPSDAAILEAAGLPLVLGTQSRRGLMDFQVVLVSNSWILEQANLPFLLSRSGVPVWAISRGEQRPPIILGGSNASAAHALVSETGDCMADAVFFGEGEGIAGRIVQLWAGLAGLPKRERLQKIASEVPGLWVAGTLPQAMRRARARTDGLHTGPAPVLPGPEAATARVAITLGCPCLCSFCFEGHDRRPFREVPAEEILSRARQLKLHSGASTLEVESFNFNTHSQLAAVLEGLHRMYLRVNLMSQRVDILARTPGLLDLELASDKHVFTLGVEGISQVVRRFLHKSLEEADIRRVLELLHERPVREVKLFYILTGRETEADFEEFARFVKDLKQARLRAHAPPRTVFSFGYLVRMPFTPLRHDPLSTDERRWRAAAGRAKSIVETNGFEFRLSSSWPEFLASQALARGGYTLHALLQRLAAAGSITDNGLSQPALLAVEEWLAANRAELESEKPENHAFPFGFLDDENSRRFFFRQYRRAQERTEAPFAARVEVPPAAIQSVGELVRRKRRLAPVLVRAQVPTEAAGMGSPWIDAWLLRAYLERHPGEVDNVLSVAESFGARSGVIGEELRWCGKTTAAVIAWDEKAFLESLAPGDEPLGPPDPQSGAAEIRELEIRVRLPADLFPDPARRLAEFLRDAHAPVTITGPAAGCAFAVPEKSRKKHLVFAGACRREGPDHVLDLRIGTRPFLQEWLQSFGQPESARLALVQLRSLGPARG
jgi:radical SAM superfamily enzyme YgiQ (UPF0313 family)